MPRRLVERLAFGIEFTGNDGLMLLQGDAALLLELEDKGPPASRTILERRVTIINPPSNYCQTIILLELSLEVNYEISVWAEVAEDIAPIKYYDVVPVAGLDQIFEISKIRLKPFVRGDFHKCCNDSDLAIVGRSNQADNPVQPPTRSSTGQHF